MEGQITQWHGRHLKHPASSNYIFVDFVGLLWGTSVPWSCFLPPTFLAMKSLSRSPSVFWEDYFATSRERPGNVQTFITIHCPVTSLFLNYEPDLRGSSASVFSWGFAAQGTLLLPWRNYQQSLPKVLPLDGAQFHHFFGALLTKNRWCDRLESDVNVTAERQCGSPTLSGLADPPKFHWWLWGYGWTPG